MTVVVETAVAIDFWSCAFMENFVDACAVEFFGETRLLRCFLRSGSAREPGGGRLGRCCHKRSAPDGWLRSFRGRGGASLWLLR